jgi:hypothetical protein
VLHTVRPQGAETQTRAEFAFGGPSGTSILNKEVASSKSQFLKKKKTKPIYINFFSQQELYLKRTCWRRKNVTEKI